VPAAEEVKYQELAGGSTCRANRYGCTVWYRRAGTNRGGRGERERQRGRDRERDRDRDRMNYYFLTWQFPKAMINIREILA
jgi:hypothetical protein